MSSVDAEQWIREAREGSRAAFERLYRSYVNQIYGLCLRMMTNAPDAEDCVQNTFVNAWRNLGQFQGRSDFATWLHRIAVNEVLMLNRRKRTTAEPLLADQLPAKSTSDDTVLDLEAAIADLPEQARHVFVLRAIYGHRHEEIAELLDLATGTVRAHYHHARRMLMHRLGLEESND